MIKIVGSYISPYVRKVLACLELKGLPYEVDPIVPFFGNDDFSTISPVRRIPVLIDEDVCLPDSSIICEYLDERYPDVPVYPREPAARANARWIEEYADSRIGQVFIWRLFNELVINRFVWGQKPEQSVIDRALKEEIPEILSYLETLLPEDGFLFGEIGAADVSIAMCFRNVTLARSGIDFADAPKTGQFVERVLSQDCLQALRKFEDLSMATPIPEVRSALIDAGAPISRETYFDTAPRPGILKS